MEEINEVMKMPTGFRFRPSEEELINYNLKPKNLGQALPCNIVQEKPLYSGNPWQVLDVRDQENKWKVSETGPEKVTNMTIYVFTKLTKKKHAAGSGGRKKEAAGGGGREQFVRTAGCGTWDGQTGPKEIKNGKGEVIGFKKMLVFKIGSLNPSTSTSSADETNNPGHWISHEYSLPGGEWEYVLCEITIKLKKSSKKRKSFEDLEEISVRKSSSPRVEFGTANCEGDVGVNNYMEVVAHPVEIEGASNGEDGVDANCNYMEVVPQPIAATGQLYGDGYNELMLMVTEELGGSQIQQPLAAFGYVNGGQYQANDEQLMMMSGTGICGNEDNQIQQPLAAIDYGNGGQYQANDNQLMMNHTGLIWSNDNDQIQQPLASIDYGNNGDQYQANDNQLMMNHTGLIWSNDDDQIQQPLAAIDYGNGGQYQANDNQLMRMSHTGLIWSNDDDQIQQWDDLLSMEEILTQICSS